MSERTASAVLATARGEGPHLTLAGDLDSQGVARLRAVLEDEITPGARLSLDLSRVTHLSSDALALLVETYRRQRDSGGSLVVAAASPPVVRTLRVSGLHRVLPVEAGPQQQAVAHVPEQQVHALPS